MEMESPPALLGPCSWSLTTGGFLMCGCIVQYGGGGSALHMWLFEFVGNNPLSNRKIHCI
jgi:hypothetical protein